MNESVESNADEKPPNALPNRNQTRTKWADAILIMQTAHLR